MRVRTCLSSGSSPAEPLEGFAAVAGSVVGDHRDRGGSLADDGVVGVEDVHQAAVGAQIDQAQDALGFCDGEFNASHCIHAATGGCDGDGQAVLSGVVDDRADPPDPATGGFEFGEVGLPDPVAFGGWVTEHSAAQYRPGLSVGSESLWQQQVSTP